MFLLIRWVCSGFEQKVTVVVKLELKDMHIEYMHNADMEYIIALL